MKIFGQMERAQIENLSADPSGAGLVKGRIWLNTSTGVTKFYDGSTVKTLTDSATSADDFAAAMTSTGTGSIVATATTANANTLGAKITTAADTIAAQITSTGTGSIVSTATTADANTLAAKITTAADTIAAQITSTGTGSIVSTATAANANTLGAKITTAADTIAGQVTATGANAILAAITTGVTDYTPGGLSVTGGTQASLNATGYYFKIGKLVYFTVNASWTQSVAGSTALTFNLPTVANTASFADMVNVYAFGTGGGGRTSAVIAGLSISQTVTYTSLNTGGSHVYVSGFYFSN